MRAPLTYYGGKQQLARKIIERIPPHRIYCESFCGGGAVFFRKPPSEVEVMNDTNKELINFYKVVQREFPSLESEIAITLHSRRQHQDAEVVYKYPHMFSEVKRAWAIWVLANEGFGGKLDGAFGYNRSGSMTNTIMNKKMSFSYEYAVRLENVQLECTDAIRIIQSRDTEETFHYCDPPYFNSDCGHYAGYTKEDFEQLLEALSRIKGKFLLSSYPSELLDTYIRKNDWNSIPIVMGKSMGNKSKKTEVLTANFPI
jgi:DNA adenine methylase